MFAIIRKNVQILDYFLVGESGRSRALIFFRTGDGRWRRNGPFWYWYGGLPSGAWQLMPLLRAAPLPRNARCVCVCDVGSEWRSFSSVYTSPLFVGTAEKKGIPWLFCSIAVWFRIRVPPALFCLLMCWATGKRALTIS